MESPEKIISRTEENADGREIGVLCAETVGENHLPAPRFKRSTSIFGSIANRLKGRKTMNGKQKTSNNRHKLSFQKLFYNSNIPKIDM